MLTYATAPKRQSDYAFIESFERLAPLVSQNPPSAIFVNASFWKHIVSMSKDSMFFRYVTLTSGVELISAGVVGTMSNVPIIVDSFAHPSTIVPWMKSCKDGFYVTYVAGEEIAKRND